MMGRKSHPDGTPAAPPPAQPDEKQVQVLQWGAELQRDLAQTMGGVLLRGARPVPVGLSRDATKRPATSPGNALMGFAIKNLSPTSPCTVTFIDGEDEDGDVVLEVELSPSESASEWFGFSGVSLRQGLFYLDPSNQTKGSVFLRGSDY